MTRLTSWCVGACSLLVGCIEAPFSPGVEGTLSLAAAPDGGAVPGIEMRACPTELAAPPRCAGTDREPVWSRTMRPTSSSPLTLPYKYAVEMPGPSRNSTSEYSEWTVIAWVTSADAGSEPARGEWYGSATFSLFPGVDGRGFAGIAEADIVIDRQVP